MKRMLKNTYLVLGAIMVLVLVALAFIVPAVSPYGVEQMDMPNRFALPGPAHWLGTDNFGRDLMIRLASGAQISLFIGVGTVVVSSVLGISVGLLAGYFGGWLDAVLMRIADIFLAFPAFILALAIIAVLGPGPVNLIVALAAVSWTQYARVSRAMTMTERHKDYILAVQSVGVSPLKIMLVHILPNISGPLVVLATFGMGTAIVSESGMSFLGLGVQPPTPTWGWSLAYGLKYLRSEPWMSTAAGLAITFAVLAFNLLGDGIRDHLDPSQVTRKASRKAIETAFQSSPSSKQTA